MRVLFETQGQSFVFLVMMYLGLWIGAMDQMTAWLVKKRKRALSVFTCALICAAGTAGGVWLLIYTGQPSLRGYGLLGILCGWLLYAMGIGRLTAHIAGRIGQGRKQRR